MTYRLLIALAASVSLGLAFFAGMLVYRYVFRPGGHLHAVIRRQAILSQAQQVPAGGIVILGDSIVELAFLGGICGQTVLNAGLGGAFLEDIANLSKLVLDRARPTSVIISVGVNDAEISKVKSIDRWLDRYDALLDTLSNYRVFVMAIDPVEVGKTFGDKYFDQSFIDKENLGLITLAKKHGANYIPPTQSAAGLTSDGVHPNEMGYRAFTRRLEIAYGCKSPTQ